MRPKGEYEYIRRAEYQCDRGAVDEELQATRNKAMIKLLEGKIIISNRARDSVSAGILDFSHFFRDFQLKWDFGDVLRNHFLAK